MNPIKQGISNPILMKVDELNFQDVLQIPLRCNACNLENFNIWGTIINNNLKIEVRCMRCGKINRSMEKKTSF